MVLDPVQLIKSSLISLWSFYPLWGPFLGFLLLKIAYKFWVAPWLRRIGKLPDLNRLNGMTGIEFERALRQIFERDGWRVELTPVSGDYGADLVMTKAGKRVVVQAKRWRKMVGIKAVQEALGARDHYRADEAWVVTQSTFSRAAVAQAKVSRVRLREGDWLAREILRLNQTVKKAA